MASYFPLRCAPMDSVQIHGSFLYNACIDLSSRTGYNPIIIRNTYYVLRRRKSGGKEG